MVKKNKKQNHIFEIQSRYNELAVGDSYYSAKSNIS